MNTRRRILLSSYLLWAAVIPCQYVEGKQSTVRPNPQFIAIDDLRPDAIGIAGGHARSLRQFSRSRQLTGCSMRTLALLTDDADRFSETKRRTKRVPNAVERLSVELETAFALHFVDPHRNVSASFERAKPGPFKKCDTEVGRWSPSGGQTIVDNEHAKTGKHCLQLKGGEKTTVILQIADGVDTSGVLSLWAERWTVREPFSFRIEKETDDGWQEIYNGDNQVRVGRSFLSQIKIPLGDVAVERVRFTCSSPPKTGILLDEIRISPAQPQKIVSVKVDPFTLPALVGTGASPLVKLRIETLGLLNPISLKALQGTLDGTTDRSDLTSVTIRTAGTTLETQPTADGSFTFSLPDTSGMLTEGENFVWIDGALDRQANIDHRVGAAIKQVTFSNGRTFQLDSAPSVQRMGVAVRNAGDDGVHTYRIPGLATTNKGTLIGVYDVRRRGGGDLPNDIDVGMSRSDNGGKTWEPMQVIMDMGDDPNWRYDGIGDPAVLVDRGTGTIWVAATWSHGNRSWHGSGPGLTPAETGQLMLVHSDDDGVTWSKPINITRQVKLPEWCFVLQAPGKGITMRDGTLVFAAQYQDTPEKHRLPHSTIIYSKDQGKTWQAGTGAFGDTTESQVVESEPGVLMLNCRYNRNSARVVMTTRDMGKSWEKHPTSERALIEPRACMASLIDVNREVSKNVGGWLLFSNPDSHQKRQRMMIKASPDRGLSWPQEHRLLLDQDPSAGYSCLTMIDEKTVGILYEGSQAHMTFQRVSLSDVVENKSPVRRTSQSLDSASDQTGDGNARHATLRLPRVFGDHMVLQADSKIPIWGQSKANAKVTVTFGDETQSTRANEMGQWQIRLKPRAASAKPAELLIHSADQRIEFRDVLVGEVWVCAGQSNMEWPLRQSTGGAEALLEADQSDLRLLHLPGGARGSSGSYSAKQLARLTPEAFCDGEWDVASAESAQNFSAVAWYFGRSLQRELNVPVGLICPATGGTPIEAWIPQEAIEADSQLQGLVVGNWLDNPRLAEFCRQRGRQNLLRAIQSGAAVPGDALGPNHSFKPGFMWLAGIEPLIPYAIRGAIWYQGESNAETFVTVREYRRLFPLLIEQWRERWGQGDFPFLFVQLPAMDRPAWPLFREVQRRVLTQLDNVGMAVTIDTGLSNDVHPPWKQPVGERLAKHAFGTTYELKSHPIYSGPMVVVAEREGDSMVVLFKHVGDGLRSLDDLPLRHFEICAVDGVFRPATAEVIDRNSIAVSSPRIAKPTDVRYAWSPFPHPPVNLGNSVGLPASPFTTEADAVLFK